MKKFRNIIALALSLVLLFSITASARIITSESIATEAFEYPITPEKTPEIWKSFGTHQQMVDACEIPQKTLKTMSTKELLLAGINYPLAGDAFCYDDISKGFEIVMKNSNALSELFSRSDFSDALASLFETKTAVKLKANSGSSEYAVQFLNVMTEYAVNNDLINYRDKNRIINSLNNFRLGLSDESFLLNEEDFAYQGVIKTQSKYYTVLNGNKYYYTYSSVKTPKNSVVTAKKYTNDLYNSDIEDSRNYLKNVYPNATILAKPSILYNCHSYAWHSASTSNKFWINDPSKYMSDGSYKYLGIISSSSSSVTGAVHGNKAFYKNTDGTYNHSAIIYNSTSYTSKWGSNCLVRHAQAYCPYWFNTTKIKIYARA